MYIVAIIELLPNRGFHFEEAVGPFNTKDEAFAWSKGFVGKDEPPELKSADDSLPTKPPQVTFVVELKAPGEIVVQPDERD